MEDTDEKNVLGEQGEKLSKTNQVSWPLEACLEHQVMKYQIVGWPSIET